MEEQPKRTVSGIVMGLVIMPNAGGRLTIVLYEGETSGQYVLCRDCRLFINDKAVDLGTVASWVQENQCRVEMHWKDVDEIGRANFTARSRQELDADYAEKSQDR